MPDLCGDKPKKKRKKWVGQTHTVEKVGGPLAHMTHTVPPPVSCTQKMIEKLGKI